MDYGSVGGAQIAASHGPRDRPGTQGVLPCLPDLSCVQRLPRSQLLSRQSQALPCCPPPLPAHPSSRFVQNFGLGSVVVAPGLSPPDFSASATGGCQGHCQPQSEASASCQKKGGEIATMAGTPSSTSCRRLRAAPPSALCAQAATQRTRPRHNASRALSPAYAHQGWAACLCTASPPRAHAHSRAGACVGPIELACLCQ